MIAHNQTKRIETETFRYVVRHCLTTNTAFFNTNWRDVQIKNVVNNVDMSSLRAPWQNGPYKD